MSSTDRTPSEERVKLLISEALAQHERHMREYLDERFSDLEQTFRSAYPDGDPHGHRLAHEEAIRNAEGWRKLKGELLSKVISGGVWAALAWLAISGWHQFLDTISKRS